MLKHHRLVLEELNDLFEANGEYCFVGFDVLENRTLMDRKTVRRVCRHLARKGMTEFRKGLWTEEGEPAGAGYRITEKGRASIQS